MLKLAQETVRMLSSDELARAAGGSGCITPSYTTDHPTTTGNTAGC